MSTTGSYRKNQLNVPNKVELQVIHDNLDTANTALLKIDDAAIDGLSGTPNSLAYKLSALEGHHHNSNLVYGMLSGFVSANYPVAFQLTAGASNAWGTELHIHAGDVVGGGSAVYKYDMNTLYVNAVQTANKVCIVEFLHGTLGTPVTNIVTDDSDDDFEKIGHGFVNGDKVLVTAAATTTGINTYTVYYVINVGGTANHFQLSNTLGGSAITLGTGDGTCSIGKLTQTSLTSVVVSMANTTSDSVPFQLLSPRIACNERLFVRAKSAGAGTCTIDFLLGLHTYTA